MRLLARSQPERVIVREYGRDSLLVWANIVLAPLFAALGLRLGLRSDERVARLMEEDVTRMRRRGYLVSSIETFSLPVPGGHGTSAHWYRITFELYSPPPKS